MTTKIVQLDCISCGHPHHVKARVWLDRRIVYWLGYCPKKLDNGKPFIQLVRMIHTVDSFADAKKYGCVTQWRSKREGEIRADFYRLAETLAKMPKSKIERLNTILSAHHGIVIERIGSILDK